MSKTTKQQELVPVQSEEAKDEIKILPLESLDFVATMKIGTLTTNAKIIRDSIKKA